MILRISLMPAGSVRPSLHIRPFLSWLPLFIVMVTIITARAQPAKGANKFVGNITTRGAVRQDFIQYWNQITGENESKWQSVEGSRDKMNWTGTDNIAKYAEEQGISWKFHTLIWGDQYPSWMNNLSQSEQLAEITEWMDSAVSRYPDVPMIDVVNEAYPSHRPAPYRNALGGDGSTGFDWIIKSFQMARERWPKAILIYNDYNNCEYGSEVDWTVKLINAMLKADAPIDAIGCQAHDAYKLSTSAVKSNIDKLAATGLPIFITEYDIGQSNDATQQNIMKEQFTMFWNHPKIIGITYWGYIVGSTWRSGTGLMSSSGAERPALTWLVDYVKNNPNPPNDYPELLNKTTVGIASRNSVPKSAPYSIAAQHDRQYREYFDLQGRVIRAYRIDNRMHPLLSIGSSQGRYILKQSDGHGTNVFSSVR